MFFKKKNSPRKLKTYSPASYSLRWHPHTTLMEAIAMSQLQPNSRTLAFSEDDNKDSIYHSNPAFFTFWKCRNILNISLRKMQIQKFLHSKFEVTHTPNPSKLWPLPIYFHHYLPSDFTFWPHQAHSCPCTLLILTIWYKAK